MRLLWVENNAQFAAVALRVFLQDFSVCVVPSLKDARLRLTEEVFDSILLDYDLDDGKGTELVPLVLSLPNRPFLIAASSHAEGNNQLSKAGADVICSKMDFARIATILAAVNTNPISSADVSPHPTS